MISIEDWLQKLDRESDRDEHDPSATALVDEIRAREAQAEKEQEIEDELINLSLWADTVIEWAAQVKQAALASERQRAWSAVEEIQCEASEKMEDYPL